MLTSSVGPNFPYREDGEGVSTDSAFFNSASHSHSHSLSVPHRSFFALASTLLSLSCVSICFPKSAWLSLRIILKALYSLR
ncbi:hypothetical protein [Phaffia rhodozyma]|uniref:Uncharacterized protein n=1 Tax=Phaffia rhodozyma TaxID=264483 RepID=A0A0F7SWM5_PHARH|nr:hypothetical protein [Phaffia rhodozyma]